MENLVSFWGKRRVFITGHTGFKGSWLALWLANLGAQVRGYALDPATEPNMFTAARVGSALEDIRGDILDLERLQTALREFAPQVVFHLAAQPLVRRSYSDPLGTYSTNVLGTANVLEAVRHTPEVRAVVCVTTDKCYENREWVWPYRETDSLGGYDPYSSSKACAELVTAAYRNSFFSADSQREHPVGVATARAGNVIGGGDWSQDRLIPDLIRGFETGEPVRIRRPKSTRPWQHVLEPLHGYLLLAEGLFSGEPKYSAPFNFGPGDQDVWSVDQIATQVSALWGGGAHWIPDCDQHVHEAGCLTLDSSKARSELRWQPRLPLVTALKWTTDWYQAFRKGDDMHSVTSNQILQFGRL